MTSSRFPVLENGKNWIAIVVKNRKERFYIKIKKKKFNFSNKNIIRENYSKVNNAVFSEM